MPAKLPPAYQELRTVLREIATLGAIGALLNWDQETYMPAAGGATRAEQQAMIASLAHERRTSARLGELIAACEADTSLTGNASSAEARNIAEARRDYDLATKLPKELVAELAKVGSHAQDVWKQARQDSNFKLFAPWLEKMIGLVRTKADCYGVKPGGERYDALLDEYEPGMTAREIESIFTPLRGRLAPLVAEIGKARTKPNGKVLTKKIDPRAQHEFGQFLLKSLGFSLEAGRLDTTTHPFCSGMAPGDTRLTTRYRDEKFTDAMFGTLHEMGHGLYEQGLPKDERFGEPLGDAISLGIHESQSRMWENFVGRGKPFWTWALPRAKKYFGKPMSAVSVDEMYAACNIVSPSFIRVEADEATYNLHIMLRFQIERALLAGELEAKDVPGVWNRLFQDYLGLKVPDDRRGCLQDVHWSFGLIGYFPTYTLGNLYAAQFWETINQDIPDLKKQMSKGKFDGLKGWLNSKIHAHGRRYRAGELCKKITGKPLSADPLMRHLEGKLKPIYGL